MHVTIPDDIAAYLHAHWGEDFPRCVLESLALEAYRERLIGEARLQRWLGFATRLEAHAFLKEHASPSTIALRTSNATDRPTKG